MDAKEFLKSKKLYGGLNYLPELLEEYAEQKCMEQKEIDMRAFVSHEYPAVLMDIKNAPLATDK